MIWKILFDHNEYKNKNDLEGYYVKELIRKKMNRPLFLVGKMKGLRCELSLW